MRKAEKPSEYKFPYDHKVFPLAQCRTTNFFNCVLKGSSAPCKIKFTLQRQRKGQGKLLMCSYQFPLPLQTFHGVLAFLLSLSLPIWSGCVSETISHSDLKQSPFKPEPTQQITPDHKPEYLYQAKYLKQFPNVLIHSESIPQVIQFESDQVISLLKKPSLAPPSPSE